LGLQVGEAHSPAVLQKIVQAGVRNRSYTEASRELSESAELCVSPKAVERVVRRIGSERVAERDAATEAFLALPLPEQRDGCPQPKAPSVAVVQFDCGRMLVRERTKASTASAELVPAVGDGQQPATTEDDAHREERIVEAAIWAAAQCSAEAEADQQLGEPTPLAAEEMPVDECRSRYWRDSKVGCLLSMHSVEQAEDPCPEIPVSFLEISRITELVRQLGGHASGVPPAPAEPSVEQGQQSGHGRRPGSPVPLVRTILASRACSAVFGAMLVAAAWARGFAAAKRKAFVADGAAMNWTMWARYFSYYVPILDFIHALQYVFAAAMAGRSFHSGWEVYCRWIQWVWEGRVAKVIGELRQRQEELGLPPKEASATDPRKIVAVTLGYLETHQSRMDYGRYRRLGLPIMSCYAESAVKQINYRVKGTEKFWGEAGAEAVLQLRADYLSETQPLARFWKHRQHTATGQRCYRCAV
jgi:hypothetical protein